MTSFGSFRLLQGSNLVLGAEWPMVKSPKRRQQGMDILVFFFTVSQREGRFSDFVRPRPDRFSNRLLGGSTICAFTCSGCQSCGHHLDATWPRELVWVPSVNRVGSVLGGPHQNLFVSFWFRFNNAKRPKMLGVEGGGGGTHTTMHTRI